MGDEEAYARRRAMRLHQAEERRRQVRRRRAVAAAAAVVMLLVAGVAIGRLVGGDGSAADPVAKGRPAGSSPAASSTASTSSPPKPTGTVTISAVGDTMLGYANTLAPNPGSYFDGVRSQITGDIRFANLEGTLTDRTSGKCAVLTSSCYEFRVPQSWARYFKHAGFTIVSNANNHAFDFWQGGLDDTVAALDRAGLAHTGRTHEITYVKVRDLTVAFIGVASYPNTGPLNDYAAAARLIHQAGRHADIVVVAMHAGAEGTAALHLTGQDEIYGGENRGNPEAFARMAIDNGADLVLGYSPHVLRAMEVYRHRLIAYSLGNFAGYHNFTTEGDLGVSGILHVKLAADGRFLSGRFVSTLLAGPGMPELDPDGRGAALIEQLSREDLGGRGAHVSPSGRITP
ncbi:MAG TPA: CapA family protein [Gaiellales bacterium]|nr:CapA family protein [Gaiellales bacterium]